MKNKLTIANIYNLYNQINADAFAGRLPLVKLEIGRATRQLGSFRYPIKIAGAPIDNLHRCSIRVSGAFERSESEYRDTIAHEMIHLYLWLAGVNEPQHGQAFLRMMNEINQRCGYAMTVKSEAKVSEENYRFKRIYLVVISWRDGTRTISRVASTYIFEFHRFLSQQPNVVAEDWYGALDSWFERFPAIRTPKFYAITQDEYEKYIPNCVALEIKGNVIQVKENH